jgi:hypothetical protein
VRASCERTDEEGATCNLLQRTSSSGSASPLIRRRGCGPRQRPPLTPKRLITRTADKSITLPSVFREDRVRHQYTAGNLVCDACRCRADRRGVYSQSAQDRGTNLPDFRATHGLPFAAVLIRPRLSFMRISLAASAEAACTISGR